ncbi:MAG: hypothetical protein GKS00_02070 [Alphaproteobacteria bacterium]|nr:hypothetical protein [Alphaproteobacteria bacterium]
MNVNDPRVVASSRRFHASLAALRKANRPRYAVARHPRRRGFTLLDAAHRESIGDDVEGIGWIYWPEPRRLPPETGWYRRRTDAEKRARDLNDCFFAETEAGGAPYGPGPAS